MRRPTRWPSCRIPDEVQRIVAICGKYDTPVIAYGTGTSLEGHFTAPFGGISIDLSGMNRILEVNAADLDCRVEAGVTRKQLNVHLRDQGLFFPVDPGADASLGGMTATRASGTNAVRYGTMRENVLNVTAVMANGEIIRTGSRAKKSSAGYDLTRLLVGSRRNAWRHHRSGAEALRHSGIDCRGRLPVSQRRSLLQRHHHGHPDGTAGGAYRTGRRRACEGLQRLFASSIWPSRPRCSSSSTGPWPRPGSRPKPLRQSPRNSAAGPIAGPTKEEDRQKLWQARHDAFWATRSLMPGKDAFATDVCVPISRLAECVTDTQADLAAHGLYGPIVGHVGDGNFHVVLYCDRSDPDEVARVKGVYGRLIDRAIAMGGTCTGEHGIGSGKVAYLEREHGPALAFMRDIKRALDPKNIMNPGKNAAFD